MFISISPEYNEDTREYLKAYHLITMNNSEETIIEINDKKPKKAWVLQPAMDKYQKSTWHKSGARKNNIFEEEKLLNPLCN